jgi:hypothetical protein
MKRTGGIEFFSRWSVLFAIRLFIPRAAIQLASEISSNTNHSGNCNMTSNDKSEAVKAEATPRPTLPAHVTIFSPSDSSSATTLLGSNIFTRLSLSPNTASSQLSSLQKDARLSESHALLHHHSILIFDSESSEIEGKDLQGAHHDHFRAVCLALKDNDIAISVAGCVYDKKTAVEAGFQLDQLSDGAVMVIDLMHGNEEDDDVEDSDDEGGLEMMTVEGDVETEKA